MFDGWRPQCSQSIQRLRYRCPRAGSTRRPCRPASVATTLTPNTRMLATSNDRGHRGSPAKNPREAFVEGGHRIIQISAALVAARGADAHQRPARRTNFRPGLLAFTAAKKSTHGASPTVHAHLPRIGKRQFSSLRTRTLRSYNTGVGEIACYGERITRGGPAHGQI